MQLDLTDEELAQIKRELDLYGISWATDVTDKERIAGYQKALANIRAEHKREIENYAKQCRCKCGAVNLLLKK